MDSIQTILVAEDDEADRLLGKRAMEKAGFCNDLCLCARCGADHRSEVISTGKGNRTGKWLGGWESLQRP